MRHDEDLPFMNRIKYYVNECNKTNAEAHRRFDQAAHAVRRVFDVSLDTMKIKFQQQTTAAVAAVIASTKSDVPESKPAYVLQSQQLDDDDIITVKRLKGAALKAFRKPCDPLSTVAVVNDRVGKGPGGRDILVPYCPLPLPDSKYLDNLLLLVVNALEGPNLQSEHLLLNGQSNEEKSHIGRSLFDGCIMVLDKKRPPENASDYFNGACSNELANVAVGADSTRYERGPCVPMVITRFGLGALLQADDSVISVVSTTKENKRKKEEEAVVASGESLHNGPEKQSSESDAQNGTQNSESDVKEIAQEKLPPPPWQYIIDDIKLRASLCKSIQQRGYPSSQEKFAEASSDLMAEIRQHSSLSFLSNTTRTPFFTLEDTVRQDLNSAGFEWSEKKLSIKEYFQSIFLPHCLRLCLLLSGDLNKIAASKGLGALNGLNSIPDPFLPISSHSEEAMTRAYSILRRARLMKALRFVVGGGVPFSAVKNILKGPLLRQLASEVPVWWCPWIHDLGLMVYTAFHGFEATVSELPHLQQPFIEQHIREVFLNNKNIYLPRCFVDNATTDELNIWIKTHAEQFPTFVAIERRLAFLCSELTRDTEVQYDNVPIYDCEPSNDSGLQCSTKVAGGSCLLAELERNC